MYRTIAILTTIAISAIALLGSASVDAGGGCHLPGPNNEFTDQRQATIELGPCRFTPTVVRVNPGQQLTWTNVSSEPHTVSGAAGSWGSDTQLLEGDSVTYSFDESGVFPYFCALHPGMVGAVVVGDGRAAGTSTRGSGVNTALAAPVRELPTSGSEPAAPTSGGANVALIAGVAVLSAAAGFASAALFAKRRATQLAGPCQP